MLAKPGESGSSIRSLGTWALHVVGGKDIEKVNMAVATAQLKSYPVILIHLFISRVTRSFNSGHVILGTVQHKCILIKKSFKNNG